MLNPSPRIPVYKELSNALVIIVKVLGSIWVVVKIMVPFWVPIIIRHLIFRVPKKGP